MMKKITSFKNLKVGDCLKIQSADTWVIDKIIEIHDNWLNVITVFGGSGTGDWQTIGMKGIIEKDNLSYNWVTLFLLTESEVMAYKL